MRQLRASAALRESRKARRFITGSTPGMPTHTGHVAELGGRPKVVAQPQKSFVLVRSCTWTSRPMMMCGSSTETFLDLLAFHPLHFPGSQSVDATYNCDFLACDLFFEQVAALR